MIRSFFLSMILATVAFAATARTEQDFCRGWECDGKPVDLPHDAMFALPWSKTADHSQGVYKPVPEETVYRKVFDFDPLWKDQHVFLEFGGIMFYGEVRVNGRLVGTSEYGYLGLSCDITEALRKDASNTVEVRAKVNASRHGACRWYTGAGLYRSVRLVAKPEKSISRHGVCVRTRENRFVDVEVMVDGFTGNDENWVAELSIRRKGESFHVAETSAAVPKGDNRKRVHFAFPAVEVADAALWSVDTPNLYVADVRLVHNRQVVDAVSVRFGIRTIDYSADFGFKLNGRKVFLKGISGHTDTGALGNAAFKDAIARQLKVLKDFGFNAVRCSHNPYSEEFYDLADEMGFLVVDEVVDKWTDCWAGRVRYIDQWVPCVTEWVLRDRNHPSVIMWSLGNELQMAESMVGYPLDDWGVTTYKMMDVLVKRWDATRPTTVAMFPARANAVRWSNKAFYEPPYRPPELACETAIASFNYQWEEYPNYRKTCPDMIFFQSEASTRDWLEAYFGMDLARDVGCSYWGAIEYWGESNAYPKKGWNFSFFSHTLRPFPSAYLIRGGFGGDRPFCHLGISESEETLVWNDVKSGHAVLRENWNRRKGEKSDVYVFSNGVEVELFLNGKSLGKKANLLPPSGKCATRDAAGRRIFAVLYEDVAWEPGELKAVSSNGESHAVRTTGSVADVRVTKDFDGDELAYYWIEAVDADGAVVPDAKCRVRVTVEGDASLLALDEGDHHTELPFAVDEKSMREGYLLATVRKGRNGGTHKVIARRL